MLPIAVTLVAYGSLRHIQSVRLSDLGLLVAGATATVLVLASVACPRCRRRLLTAVFSAPDGNAAITGFLARRTCPSCGHDPRPEAP